MPPVMLSHKQRPAPMPAREGAGTGTLIAGLPPGTSAFAQSRLGATTDMTLEINFFLHFVSARGLVVSTLLACCCCLIFNIKIAGLSLGDSTHVRNVIDGLGATTDTPLANCIYLQDLFPSGVVLAGQEALTVCCCLIVNIMVACLPPGDSAPCRAISKPRLTRSWGGPGFTRAPDRTPFLSPFSVSWILGRSPSEDKLINYSLYVTSWCPPFRSSQRPRLCPDRLLLLPEHQPRDTTFAVPPPWSPACRSATRPATALSRAYYDADNHGRRRFDPRQRVGVSPPLCCAL